IAVVVGKERIAIKGIEIRYEWLKVFSNDGSSRFFAIVRWGWHFTGGDARVMQNSRVLKTGIGVEGVGYIGQRPKQRTGEVLSLRGRQNCIVIGGLIPLIMGIG